MSQEFYFKKIFLFAFIAAFLVSCSSTAKYNISDEKGQGKLDGEIIDIKVINPSAIEITARVTNNLENRIDFISFCSLMLYDSSGTYGVEVIPWLVLGKGEIVGKNIDDGMDPGWVGERSQTFQINKQGAEYITEVDFNCTE